MLPLNAEFLVADHTKLFEQFSDTPSFKKWLVETIFTGRCGQNAA
jgi:hypothetical protein